MLDRKTFYINSRSRSNGTNSDFTYEVKTNSNIKYTHAVVLQAYIPKSYYLIPEGKNTFTLSETTDATITIPVGNYTRIKLRDKLSALLTAGSPNGYTYTVSIPDTTSPTISPETGKYTFTVSGNGGYQPSLVFSDYVYEQLGFNANSTNTFVSDTIDSTNVVNLQRESTLFIHSDLVSNGSDSVLQEIYSNEADFSAITYQCPDPLSIAKPITTNDSDSYRFYLTDENDNAINLNGQNLVLTLLLFKKDNSLAFLKRYLQLSLED